MSDDRLRASIFTLPQERVHFGTDAGGGGGGGF
jgi:hypothetical protein